MEKKIIKVTCERNTVTKQGSNVMFAAEVKTEPAAPGQPPRRTAGKVIQFNFDDDSAKDFSPGKNYTITIE